MKSSSSRPLRAAMIGAGVSGLVCARRLSEQGIDVVVFDKSRGVGGRMATRRAEETLRFDHGAQYFTARDEPFQNEVRDWIQQGAVALWEGRIGEFHEGRAALKEEGVERFVGVPGMNAICKHLAKGLDIRFKTRAAPPVREGDVWKLLDDSLGEFDRVLVSTPAPQAAELLRNAPALAQQAAAAPMSGCWAAMLAFDRPLGLPLDGAFVQDSLLSWIARNNSKPGRDAAPETWVLHASAEWSQQHIDQEPAEILPLLMDAFWRATGAAPHAASFSTSHRWRYAIPSEPLPEHCLYDAALGVGACGDWCGGPRVEGAYRSGANLANRVLASL